MFRPAAAKGAAKAKAGAKAKGMPKAKGAPKAGARPRLRLRRPAARVRRGDEGGEEASPDKVLEKLIGGEKVEACQLPAGKIPTEAWIKSEDAIYFGNKIKVAGYVKKEEFDQGERQLLVMASGTTSEDLLRHLSGVQPPLMRWHLCSRECPQLRTSPELCHIKTMSLLGEGEKTWESNLTPEEGMAGLRRDHEDWDAKNKEDKEPEKVKSSSSEETKKKKKKKKEKAKKKRPPEKKLGSKAAARKPLDKVFEYTGMDPDHRRRRKLMKKAKKTLKRSKEAATESSSGDSKTDSEEDVDQILEDRSKVHRLASVAPGLLSSTTIETLRPLVSQVTGNDWDDDSV